MIETWLGTGRERADIFKADGEFIAVMEPMIPY
jgi:hypothetical protein